MNETSPEIHQNNTDWMKLGQCKDLPPVFMFPSETAGVAAAKEICRTCVVKDVCLEYAVDKRIDHGVWGGTSERERRRIIKSRRNNQS